MDEKMRAEFEAWALREYYLSEYALRRGADGEYKDGRAVLAWATWKASRAALVIELPATVGYEGQYDGCDSELSEDWADFQCADVTYSLARKVEVVEAIESAGVRVKP